MLALVIAMQASALSPLLRTEGQRLKTLPLTEGQQLKTLPRTAVPADIWVNCNHGSDARNGTTPTEAVRTVKHALATHGSGGHQTVHISGGLCPVDEPLVIKTGGPSPDAPFILRGDGKTALSGGVPIKGWAPVGTSSSVLVANVPAWFPLFEIKVLRVGSDLLRRSLWPKPSGNGLSSPNYMFATPWSSGSSDPTGERSLHQLGVDPARMPPANVSLANAYAHVYGCVERDVNSQLTRVLGVGGSTTKPRLEILFRNTFAINQRFQLENIELLVRGEFYHDMLSGKIYVWPPSSAAREAMLRGAPAMVPVTDQLLEINGASNVIIENLTFLDTTYYADGL